MLMIGILNKFYYKYFFFIYLLYIIYGMEEEGKKMHVLYNNGWMVDEYKGR